MQVFEGRRRKPRTTPPQPPTFQQRAREQVDRWIKARGATQEAIAQQLVPKRNGVWMSRYLSGKIDADVDTLHQLAAIFQNDYAALFGAATTDEDGDQLRARLDRAYAAMPDQKRLLLVAIAEEFAQSLIAPRRGPQT